LVPTSTPEIPRVEFLLRRLLAHRLAGSKGYYDDGELQDSSRFPFIDYLRDHPEDIELKLAERSLKPTTKMKIFQTYEQVEGMKPCLKKPLVVHAKKMDEEFRVQTLEGDYKLGKPGDYLMTGIDGEHYIHDGPLFERAYDFV
jgi:hypothetical protein